MVILIIVIILIIIAAVIIISAVSRFKKDAREVLGTNDVIGEMKRLSAEYEGTPKSVSSMTSLLLPRIQKDFPDFNWGEFKSRIEGSVTSYLQAVESGNPSLLKGAGVNTGQALKSAIEDNKNKNINKYYDDIKIHRTEICEYKKEKGLCIIKCQTSLGYMYHETSGDTSKESDAMPRRHETRYACTLSYVQDVDKTESHETAIGLNCPNCGGPITSLGQKVCSYCGTGIVEMLRKVWILDDIHEG